MKKVLYYLIIMLAFTLNACDNEMDNMQGGDKEILTSSSEIVIKDGKITYPKWLVNVVDSVAHSHVKGTDYPYPWVFTIQGDGKEHILVLDGVNSCASCGQLLFLLSGERIEKFPNECIRDRLRQKLKEQPLLFTLLTGHSLMTLTTEVRNYQPHKKRAMTNIVQQPIHKQL